MCIRYQVLISDTWYLKYTVMKKIIFRRLFALAFFCLASLAIKSEQTFCKIQCCQPPSGKVDVESLSDLTGYENGPLPYYAFFIKI